MKQKIFMVLLLAGIATGTMGQTTKEIHGAVVDKNGNPLPGAKVEATGGAESTVTDADGTFTLEVSRWLKSATASYPGMGKKKMSLSKGNELLFTLHDGSERRWFANAVYQYDTNLEISSVGVMGGQLATWGWYAKVLFDVTDFHGHYHDFKAGVPSISAGIVKSISKPLFLYFGLGYTKCYDSEDADEGGVIFDLGLLFNYKRFNVNCGYSHRREGEDFFDNDSYYDGKGIHIGIGYTF